MPSTTSTDPPALGRRALLTGGAVGLGLGGLLGAGGALGVAALRQPGEPAEPSQTLFGGESLACHGRHQAGVVTAPAAHVRFAAYTLRPETDADALRRMFRVLTGDIEGLCSGEAPLADPEPELASRPARLTITVGVGPGLVDRADPSKRPEWLAPLPAFSRDRLGAGYDGGDLLLIVQSDDPTALSHAARMLHRDLAGFAEPLWTQQGFDSLLWLGPEAGWLEGGSAFVLRRIRMELDTWDMVDRPGREAAVGRRLSDGSPLSAPAEEADERTPADFDAKDSLGFSLIPIAAHIRRAHSEDAAERIFRRAVNYDDGAESGLLFACYQRDPLRQFVPIQQRLDEVDMLNEWITHVGSCVFAILPGFEPGEALGRSLLA